MGHGRESNDHPRPEVISHIENIHMYARTFFFLIAVITESDTNLVWTGCYMGYRGSPQLPLLLAVSNHPCINNEKEN